MFIDVYVSSLDVIISYLFLDFLLIFVYFYKGYFLLL